MLAWALDAVGRCSQIACVSIVPCAAEESRRRSVRRFDIQWRRGADSLFSADANSSAARAAALGVGARPSACCCDGGKCCVYQSISFMKSASPPPGPLPPERPGCPLSMFGPFWVPRAPSGSDFWSIFGSILAAFSDCFGEGIASDFGPAFATGGRITKTD